MQSACSLVVCTPPTAFTSSSLPRFNLAYALRLVKARSDLQGLLIIVQAKQDSGMNREHLGQSLLATFANVPDPRSRHSRRHPLPAILAEAWAAMLSGARSLYAIAQWGHLQPPGVIEALGFTRGNAPCVATLHLVFKGLDVRAFEAALTSWAQANLGEAAAIAVDGKGLRGIHSERLPGVELAAAYADRAGLVLAQTGGKQR